MVSGEGAAQHHGRCLWALYVLALVSWGPTRGTHFSGCCGSRQASRVPTETSSSEPPTSSTACLTTGTVFAQSGHLLHIGNAQRCGCGAPTQDQDDAQTHHGVPVGVPSSVPATIDMGIVGFMGLDEECKHSGSSARA